MINKIIIVGMARSGTTLVSHIFGSLPNVHNEVEPHALWKLGNFKYTNDEEFNIETSIVSNIRTKFLRDLGEIFFVEKSPINSLRPELVHAVFPDAKIVYIERNPAKCIYSNYKRSLSNDSFKLSIILKKYLYYTGSKDLAGAISKRSIFQQLRLVDIPSFSIYIAKMFWIRNVKNKLPFGSKLKNFEQIVKEKGLLNYHIEVYKKSQDYKKKYKEFYKDRMACFKLEDLMKSKSGIKDLLDFSQIPYDKDFLEKIHASFNFDRINKALIMNKDEEKIALLLEKR